MKGKDVLRLLRFMLGLLNLAALASLFFIEPDAVEPSSTPWAWWPWIAHLQFMPAVLALDFAVLGAMVLATLALGRIYCEAVCPLGVAQDVVRKLTFMKSKGVRRVCGRLPVSRLNWAVRSFFLAAAVVLAALGLGAYWLDPYGIFCAALASARIFPGDWLFASLMAAPFALVIALVFVGKGRIWCNAICPVGTVFTLLMKISAAKTTFDGHCGDCRACFPKRNAKDDEGGAR